MRLPSAIPKRDRCAESKMERALYSPTRKTGVRAAPSDSPVVRKSWRGMSAAGVPMAPRAVAGAVLDMADVVVITDRDGKIEYVNRAFSTITGYAPAEVIGCTLRILKSGLHPRGFYERMWHRLLSGRTFRDVIVNRRKNGELYYDERCITPLRDTSGEIVRFIATGRDVTGRIEKQERLEYLAYHDALTRLPNRALFSDRLRHTLMRARRRHQLFGLLFIDLDGFKQTNDRYGHEVGDKLLRAVAARLRNAVRDSDTVARLGGDEFAVLFDDLARIDDVGYAAAKALAAIGDPVVLNGRKLAITGSLGVSLYPADGESAAELMRNADKAMYRAKELGTNRVEFYRRQSLVEQAADTS